MLKSMYVFHVYKIVATVPSVFALVIDGDTTFGTPAFSQLKNKKNNNRNKKHYLIN